MASPVWPERGHRCRRPLSWAVPAPALPESGRILARYLRVCSERLAVRLESADVREHRGERELKMRAGDPDMPASRPGIQGSAQNGEFTRFGLMRIARVTDPIGGHGACSRSMTLNTATTLWALVLTLLAAGRVGLGTPSGGRMRVHRRTPSLALCAARAGELRQPRRRDARLGGAGRARGRRLYRPLHAPDRLPRPAR